MHDRNSLDTTEIRTVQHDLMGNVRYIVCMTKKASQICRYRHTENVVRSYHENNKCAQLFSEEICEFRFVSRSSGIKRRTRI